MRKNLLALMPKHKVYVEVFGGGAQLLFAKKPYGLEVYNDINGDLVNFFKVLADTELFEKFYRFVAVLPCSRELYNEYRETYRQEKEIWKRAAKWFLVANQAYAGKFGDSWGFVVSEVHNNMSGQVSRWLSAIKILPEIHARLQRVQIENQDFRKLIPKYDSEDTFFYLDPPYILDTRKSGEAYECEMTDDDHKELVEILLNIKGQAILSGYENDIYKPLGNAGWQRKEFQTQLSSINPRYTNGKRDYATEIVWLKLKPENDLFSQKKRAKKRANGLKPSNSSEAGLK